MHKNKIKITTLVLISAMTLVGCSFKNTNKEDTQMSGTKQATIQVGDIKEEISLSGILEANKVTNVNSTSKSIVEEVYVTTNTDVEEGDGIVLLENGVVIEAPYDGKITMINIDEGDSVDTSTNVFNIVDDSSFKIYTSIDESDITKVRVDQEVEINVSALDKGLTGVVEQIDAQATESGQSTTFGVKIDVSSTEENEQDFENVYSGMSSELSIVIKESNDILIAPINAVSSRKGVSTVTVKNGEETTMVEVEVGIQDSSYVEIVSGLNEGDTIIYTQASPSNSMSSMMGGAMFGGKMPSGMDKEAIKEMMGSGKNPSMDRPSNK